MRLLAYLPDPFRALTGAFFARFFESEITTGTDDLKGSFFWLLAALAIPGMFIPWMMAFDWHLIAMYKGPVALREASQAEKVFYLGFSMIASGMLTTIVWSSLLPDRRDTLILGTLPVHPRTIVTAKLAALLLYILLVAISMHAISSVFFGAILSTNTGTLFAFRGMFAHFVASSAASAVVALMVAAAQGLTLTLFGPRLFRRATTLLQIVLVGLVTLGLALLPVMSFSVVHTLRGFGSRMQPWVLSIPPVWFMGLYEWLLGTSDPKLLALAARAGLTLLAATALTVLTFPLAYRRLMVSVVETADGPGRFAPSRLMRGALVLLSGRHPEVRAAADFYVATIARVERHRFVIAIALGLSLAWSVPWLRTFEPSAAPAAAWLALPLCAVVFLVVGLRVAASLPGDIRASWMFEVASPSRAHSRQALERLLFVLGVLPPVLLSMPGYWWIWGRSVAVLHAAIVATLGAALVQLIIWHSDGMPCGQRWNASRVGSGYRWPFYVAAFFVITSGVPRLEPLLFAHPNFAAAFIGLLAIVAVATRVAAARRVILPSYDDVDPVAGVLRLG